MTDPHDRPRPPRRPGGTGRPPPKRPKFASLSKNLALWLIIILLPLTIYQLFLPREQARVDIKYSEFVEQLDADNVAGVTITEKQLNGRLLREAQAETERGARAYTEFRTILPFEDPDLVQRMEERGVEVEAREARINWFTQILAWLPWILIIGLWIFFIRQMQGGGSRAFSFGKSKARLLSADAPKVPFDDVAGADEAKAELDEIIEFLRDPKSWGLQAPARPFLRGPSPARRPCRSSRCRDPILSKCSWVWGRRVFEICSNRARPMRRASSSLTRSTRSAGIVGLVWVEATTSASRRSISSSSKWTVSNRMKGSF
jgi:hypothetical protein